jgi:hypothetical protein
MRRIMTTLTTLLTAGAVAVGAAGAAWAAQGVLTVSGNRYDNPAQGCYQGRFWPLSVDNQTDKPVYIFDNGNCQGDHVATVEPGGHRIFEFGSSVSVPE